MLPESCGASISTWEKSGLMVASTTTSARGRHLRSRLGTKSFSRCDGVVAPRVVTERTVTEGVSARCWVFGSASRPVSGSFRQMKQFCSRGSFELEMR